MSDFQPPITKYPKLADGILAFEVSDPAVACAIGRCWLARQVNPLVTITGAHPNKCYWCSFPTDQLICSLNDFWQNEDNWPAVKEFGYKHKDVQAHLVAKAATV